MKRSNPIRQALFAFTALLLFPLPAISQTFDFNEDCIAAYNEIFSLRIGSGKKIIAEEKRADPGNFIPLLLENYVDFLNIVISEDKTQFAAFKENKNQRISTMKAGDSNSPWLLYAQAEMHLHYALSAILFKEYWSGLVDMRKAYLLLEENRLKFPYFKPNEKTFYTITSLLGAIPEKYHFGLKLLGISGSLNDGLLNLEKITSENWNSESFLKDEAIHTYASLLLHLDGNKTKAWETIQNEKYPLKGNLFSGYTCIKIALYSYHNNEALSMLENLSQDSSYASIPILDYYRGLALLHKLDKNAATYFQKFLESWESRNLVKSAYHKIAWSRLIEGDTSGYRQYMMLVKENGDETSDADKQAQREADNSVLPNADLVKARLLFDGGYFEKALGTLKKIKIEMLPEKQYQLEYYYREARILHEMGDTVRAIERYMVTLSKGKNEPHYFAANAALNLGLIYESKGNYDLAKKYFQECLEMDNHEYKVSLKQKAKAGLERL